MLDGYIKADVKKIEMHKAVKHEDGKAKLKAKKKPSFVVFFYMFLMKDSRDKGRAPKR